MKKIINKVYAFSKTEKTFKTIVTAKNYDELLPIMEKNRDKFSWFVYNIKDKSIRDMYSKHNPGKIAFFRELVGKLEIRKSIEYAHGVTKSKQEVTKKFLDNQFKKNLDEVSNMPKHILYRPIDDIKAELMRPFTDMALIWRYMEQKRTFTQKLNELQNESINVEKLKHAGFNVKETKRQKRELCTY